MSLSAPRHPGRSTLFGADAAATHRPRRGEAALKLSAGLLNALAVRAIDAGSGGLASVGVASVLHGEGATTVACGIASCVAASLGRRVVIVDANLRRPALRRVYGLPPGPGLGDVLSGAAALEDALRAPLAGPPGGGRLMVLPASTTLSDTPAARTGAAMRDLTAALHGYAELLVFDTAPLLPYPDTTLLSHDVDGMVVVLQAERSKWDDGERAVQDLRDAGARVLGAVLNRQRAYIPRLIERLL